MEFPSQFNENWMTEPRVFANFAKHYQTGAPMPAELVAKVQRAARFNHKTVFGVLSWIIFAALLGGRHVYGWRGRIAVRWTLTGFLMLVLAYFGSRFVLEVVLQRTV